MGLYKSQVRAFLKVVAEAEIPSGPVATFGTQTIYCSLGEIYAMMHEFGMSPSSVSETDMEELSEYYGERAINGNTLLRLLGFDEIVNIDIVRHTPLTYQHDLGKPLPEEMWNRFALVFDGTTGSHVSDSMALLANGVRLLMRGGVVLHTCGLYNLGGAMPPFNPQLLTRFYEDNGFSAFRNFFCNAVHPNTCFELAGNPLFPMVLDNVQQYSLFFAAVKREDVPLALNPTEQLYLLMGKEGQLSTPSSLAGKKVAIWGTGGHYYDHYQALVEADDCPFDVWGFVDNNKERWGTEFEGRTVYSPEELKEGDVDAVLLATWQKWEVFEQLCALMARRPGVIEATFELYRHIFELKLLKDDYTGSYLARGFMSPAILERM